MNKEKNNDYCFKPMSVFGLSYLVLKALEKKNNKQKRSNTLLGWFVVRNKKEVRNT